MKEQPDKFSPKDVEALARNFGRSVPEAHKKQVLERIKALTPAAGKQPGPSECKPQPTKKPRQPGL